MNDYEEYLKNTPMPYILVDVKTNGFPEDDDEMILLFNRMAESTYNDDYPIHWADLRKYIPSFDNNFGVDRYVELHRKYQLEGDMATAIRKSGMPEIDKAYLRFVYSIID